MEEQSLVYWTAFERFKKVLTEHAVEIFLHPIPFTQINRLSMLAATVAEECFEELTKGDGDG